jgi:hypothetical protein
MAPHTYILPQLKLARKHHHYRHHYQHPAALLTDLSHPAASQCSTLLPQAKLTLQRSRCKTIVQA